MPKSIYLNCFLIVAILGLIFVPAKETMATPEPVSYSTGSGTQDGLVPEGDRQNSYSWSMEEFDGYLYVGVSRNLAFLILNDMGFTGFEIFQDHIPIPHERDLRGRIFRMKLDNPESGWKQAYISDMVSLDQPDHALGDSIPRDLGYRGMISFTPHGGSAPSLFVSTLGSVGSRIIRLNHGFEPGDTPIQVFNNPDILSSIRGMAVHDEKLYIGNLIPGSDIQILESSDPGGNETWRQIAGADDFPGARFNEQSHFYGGVWDMISFNGYLYAIIGSNYTGDESDGFLVFKGKHLGQDKADANKWGWAWKQIVGPEGAYPSGVGNPQNVTASPTIFGGHVYVGTFTDVIESANLFFNDQDIGAFIERLNPGQIYRFDPDDEWEMVVGDPDMSRGVFSHHLGNYQAGFFRPGLFQTLLGVDLNFSLNQYIWRMEVHEGRLFCSTFDLRSFEQFIEEIGRTMGQANIEDLLKQLRLFNSNSPGFDLYVSDDGLNWSPVITDGFNDPFNYGGRTLKSTRHGFFVGTANPFYGTQVWKARDSYMPRILTWLETNFQEYLGNDIQPMEEVAGILYRYYPQTSTFLATFGGRLYYLPENTGFVPQDIGGLEQWAEFIN